MQLQELPPAHLGPFESEGLRWVTLPEGRVIDGVSGVTESLAAARMAHVKLQEIGFTYTGATALGTAERMYEFRYALIEEHGVTGTQVYTRRVWIILMAITPEEIPLYEVVCRQLPHTRVGSVFSAETSPTRRRAFSSQQYLVRPTLDD